MFGVGPANLFTPFSKLRQQDHTLSAEWPDMENHNYRKVEESHAPLLENVFHRKYRDY